jgi:hypothetical protein
MDQGDGMDEEINALFRTAITVAALLAEQIARRVQEQARQAEALAEQQRAEYQARIDAERAAMRAQLQPVLDDNWWRRVTPERIGTAYESARGWAEHDDLARAVADRIRDEVQQRYGIGIDALARDATVVRTDLEIAATRNLDELTAEQRRLSYLDAQRWLAHDNPELSERIGLRLLDATSEDEVVAAQNEAIETHRRHLDAEAGQALVTVADGVDQAEEERRERDAAAREELRRQVDERTAALSWQAAGARHNRIVEELHGQARQVVTETLDQVERETRMAHWYDVADQQKGRDGLDEMAETLNRQDRMSTWYDTAARRRATEAGLTASVDDPDGIEAKMLTDVSNALPPEAAVTGGHHPRARKTRSTDGPARDLGTER